MRDRGDTTDFGACLLGTLSLHLIGMPRVPCGLRCTHCHRYAAFDTAADP